MVVSFQQTKPGSEQVRFAGRFHSWGLAALQFSSYQGQSLGEPSDGVEPVQDVTGSGKIQLDSCPVGIGTVGDHGAHTVTPSGSLFNENLLNDALDRSGNMASTSPVSPLTTQVTYRCRFSDRCLVYQQHPTLLTATPNLDPPGPVGNQFHDQMPANSVAAGHRTDGHHLGVLDQPARQPTSKTSWN